MGRDLSDDGWGGSSRPSSIPREPSPPLQSRQISRNDDRASLASITTQKSFFGGRKIVTVDDNWSSDEEAGGGRSISICTRLSTGSEVNATSRSVSLSGAPAGNIFGGPKQINPLRIRRESGSTGDSYTNRDFIDFSHTSQGNIREVEASECEPPQPTCTAGEAPTSGSAVGFGIIFGKQFHQVEKVTTPTQPVLQKNGETGLEIPSGGNTFKIPTGTHGFGKPPETGKGIGFLKREDVTNCKPPSTFVPPEEKTEKLFASTIKPGADFGMLFDCTVEICRNGLTKHSQVDKITSFDAIHLTEQIRNNINRELGYQHPTPVQQHTMPLINDGIDILACAQTGVGKTAAFLLPIMSNLLETRNFSNPSEVVCSPRCVVLVPTRELAVQIYDEGRKFGFCPGGPAAVTVKAIYGGTSVGYQKQEINKGATVLIATVGRFKHFVDDGIISLDKVKYFVLDEADRMLDMGFGEEIIDIITSYNLPPNNNRQTLMFSKMFADTLGAMLCEIRIPSTTVHGDRTQSQRAEAARDFKNGRKAVLVATDVAARGLDIPFVDLVINYDLPQDIDTYIHRIGRTGRIGNPGRAISIFTSENCSLAPHLAEALRDVGQPVPAFLEDITTRSTAFQSFSTFSQWQERW